jgi:hypothetical protein
VLSGQEKKRLMEALNRTFRDGYPNSERHGCPGSDVLMAVASRRLGLEEAEPWINHLSSCSPCTREFAELRQAFQQRQRLRLASVAAGLLIVLVAAAGYSSGNPHYLLKRRPWTLPIEVRCAALNKHNPIPPWNSVGET